MYRITTDTTTAIIEVTVAGFWSLADVNDFADDLATHVAQITSTGRRQTVLVDFTDVLIQSQEVVAVLQDMARADDYRSRRVALYSAGRTAILQAQRIAAVSDRFAVFSDRRAALAWLAAATQSVGSVRSPDQHALDRGRASEQAIAFDQVLPNRRVANRQF